MKNTIASNELKIYCDGLVEPTNPGGWGCWAWLAISPKGRRLREGRGCIGRGPEVTNNRVEYIAVLNALRYTASRREMLAERQMVVVVYSDSQLVIRQIVGEWACNTPHLRELRDEIIRWADHLRAGGVDTRFVWVPREQNMDADALTRQAYREARMNREAA